MAAAEWILLGVSTVVSLGLLELLLRLFFPLFASPYQPDDVLLVRHVPNSNKAFTRMAINGGQRIVSHYNREGFRGPELRAADHSERLIVYGDSNVQAEFSQLEATFPKQLEARLAAGQGPGAGGQPGVEGQPRVEGQPGAGGQPGIGGPGVVGPRVEVLNAGVVGDGPDQISLRLANDLQRYKPAGVIVVIFADNDFGDLIRNRIYRLDTNGDLRQGTYHLPPELRDRMQAAAHPNWIKRLQLVKRASLMKTLLKERWSGITAGNTEREFFAHYIENSLALDETAFREYMAGATDVADPFYDYYDADIALQPESPSARYKIALMEKVLLKLRDTAAATHTGLMLTILPSAIDACEHYEFAVDTQRYPQYDRTRLSGLVADIAARNDIPSVNLWPAFHRQDSTCYYFHGGDNHWNDEGQSKAAEVVAEWIKQRHWPGALGDPGGPGGRPDQG